MRPRWVMDDEPDPLPLDLMARAVIRPRLLLRENATATDTDIELHWWPANFIRSSFNWNSFMVAPSILNEPTRKRQVVSLESETVGEWEVESSPSHRNSIPLLL